IRVSLLNYQRVVILKEKDSDRYLPIWIGPNEADAIAIKLQDVSVPRPMTHDLLLQTINQLGGAIQSIVVSDLNNDTFYARIIVDVNGRQVEIDSRPSDAIALAVRAKSPIYAAAAVLEKAGIYLEDEAATAQSGSSKSGGGRRPAPSEKLDEQELEKLRPFADFINSLDLRDFDQRRDR
ncbi:MAG: bifunctional nuclease family protein, partial [Dehalococcoidia bacterium]|nr:bifunctional nuclease family protein [Dehalococcoidia bacterium]